MKKVMVVTGASKGIGLATTIAGLQNDYQVAATSRNAAQLKEIVASKLADSSLLDNFYPVEMQFNEADIHQAIASIIDRFGRIDVLVNNAGYALLGALDEVAMDEVRANFDVNVFGLLEVTQAVLPQMKKQHSGSIINLASISGTVTGPAQGIYSATKAAVIMMSEALQDEVAADGIHVTAICPSGVRTEFLSESMKEPENKTGNNTAVSQTMAGLAHLNHNQSGNPVLVAKVILKLASMEQPPVRLYLGQTALAALQQKVQQVVNSTNQNIDLSMSIDD